MFPINVADGSDFLSIETVNQAVQKMNPKERKYVSDWYHTFKELYNHRMTIFQALCNTLEKYDTELWNPSSCWKSKLHSDGTMYDNMFIAWIGQESWKTLTYHIHIGFWDTYRVPEIEKAPERDGHDSEDVLWKLMQL